MNDATQGTTNAPTSAQQPAKRLLEPVFIQDERTLPAAVELRAREAFLARVAAGSDRDAALKLAMRIVWEAAQSAERQAQAARSEKPQTTGSWRVISAADLDWVKREIERLTPTREDRRDFEFVLNRVDEMMETESPITTTAAA